MNEDLVMAMTELQRDKTLAIVKACLNAGDEPLDILRACQKGMTIIGNRFKTGDFFLAELILSGAILKEVNSVLEPHLQKTNPPTPIGNVVLATLRGDIHDLGKNIFGSLLKAQGFEVHDLGVDGYHAKKNIHDIIWFVVNEFITKVMEVASLRDDSEKEKFKGIDILSYFINILYNWIGQDPASCDFNEETMVGKQTPDFIYTSLMNRYHKLSFKTNLTDKVEK